MDKTGDRMKRLIPMLNFTPPCEISASILFRAYEEAAMINGADLLVDGGYTAI